MNPFEMKALFCIACLLAWIAPSADGAELRIRTVDDADGRTVPARIHLANAAGQPVRPTAPLPFWRDHFTSPGEVVIEVPAGRYTATVERGPEWSSETAEIEIPSAEAATSATVRLRRLVNLPAEGWWPGELHVHRPLAEAELLMRAEDLHVAPVITWWNSRVNDWLTRPLPTEMPRRFDGDRFLHPMGGEDEREGGALLYFNLPRPLDLAQSTRAFPSSLFFAREGRERGAWVDLEKPFWRDFPMWVAHGVGDSVGIANNHMQRSGVMDSEAWGRTRDTQRYSGPHGNGRWTQDIYYHLLNCGVRLPPSAGSASGVLPNPVGYNRAYVHVDGELTYEKWFAGLRAGRSFVTNGPLLRSRANGQWPGHVFQSAGPLQIALNWQLDSRDPIRVVELVRNGRAERVTLPVVFTMNESGWFLVRAIADVPATFRFASTAPWHVEIAGQPMKPVRESAEFFAAWSRDRIVEMENAAGATADQRVELAAPWRETERFWQAKLTQARPRGTRLTGRVVDAGTDGPLAARVYLRDGDGRWHFVEPAGPDGATARYGKVARANPESVEMHTSVSAHPFQAELPPGRYTLIVERGKEYFPATSEVVIGTEPVDVRVPLQRWIDMAGRGWFSGDTHVHRAMDDLPTVMLAEDLNVAFPLSFWVTRAFEPPSAGDKNLGGTIPSELVEVDRTHVFWPRNTEYELFTVGPKRHTLGAVFVLGHSSIFTGGAPPVAAVAEWAQAEGALLDLDKHDWPWAMALPPLMGVQLYELANNHLWRTKFAFTNWSTPAPPHLRPPLGGGTGGEREWIHYTLGNYYALLNGGFRMRPTAGTANGVHPVPLGFGRVYVHLPDGFSYDAWKRGLNTGRSFVTTGPMLLARVNDRDPGEVFPAKPGESFRITGTVVSEQPVSFGELIHNGTPVRTLRMQNKKSPTGAFENTFDAEIALEDSGWLAVRCWEDRPEGRVRYAHTAPWHVEIAGRPLQAPAEDREHLVTRMRDEIGRSRDVLPPSALAEYQQALAAYERIAVRDDSTAVRLSGRRPGDERELRLWLENMVWHHRFTPAEMRAATGRSFSEIEAALTRFNIGAGTRPKPAGDVLRVLPYPGGRHPRTGFLDGALEPQRETKVSVFTPWDEASYVVVDVPEAVWSNLGLTYLAHTHVPTIWSTQSVELTRLEWNRRADGSLDFERELPNRIAFGAKVVPGRDAVRFELWLRNGTGGKLTNLRIQNCVMLKGAAGFNAQTSQNKLLQPPFAAVRSDDGRRWIITAWDECNRVWANPPVPCMHSDPKFPDCDPGQTKRLKGWLWFYEGADIAAEFVRLRGEMTKPAE
ncbi:MAG: hypothetical protein EXS37_05925 [Opitutus sp.]|nr:hypothetical protein [Opitutus sp.]